jgi:hypothetical protein
MFWLPDNAGHVMRCRCDGCESGPGAALFAVYSALFEADPGTALRVMKEDGLDAGETAHVNDPFISDELALASLLGGWYSTETDAIRPILDKALDAPFNQSAMTTALQQAAADMGTIITPERETQVRTAVDTVLSNGAIDAGGNGAQSGVVQHVAGANVAEGTILEDAPSAQKVLDGITSATKYYTNRYFNEVVVPGIQQQIANFIHNGETPDMTAIREALDRRLKSVPYWRVVANAAASRGYHYGYAKAGQMVGARSYRLVAVVDDRTSQICLSLDGRTFHIADAVNLMERAAQADNPAAVKSIMPWPKSSDKLDSMTNDELRDKGYLVPPFHGNCRTGIELIF